MKIYEALSITSVHQWLSKRDPGLIALRRSTRAAIIMPLVFVITDKIIGNSAFALFASFGSLATLLLVSFSGSKRDHIVEAGAMIITELFFICLGTAVSKFIWLSVAMTGIIVFCIFCLTTLKPSLNKITTSLMVSLILPITVPGSVHAIPGRLFAWLISSLISLIAIVYLWPVTHRDRTNEVTLISLVRNIRSLKTQIQSESEKYIEPLEHAARVAISISLAVLAADLISAQHALWVILGALTVLCSNTANIDHKVENALIGTVIGIIFASGLIVTIGTNTDISWLLLPFTILFTGFAPVGISFTAGQAGFTTMLLLISNITNPIGWRVGIIRLEDIFIGCVVSLFVGVVFWPSRVKMMTRQTA
jgi:uncharacterized membrane protein YccC